MFEVTVPTAEKIVASKENPLVTKTSNVTDGQRSDRVVYSSDDVTPMQNLTGSWIGALFMVEYKLRIFVKHDAFLERGQGACISFPIRVYNAPVLVASSEPYRVPDYWNPTQGIAEHAYLYMQQGERSEYFKKVYEPNWDNWYKNVGPSEKELKK